jgi:LDH2 family malate/lactate/ureidoglycolate dehydrogenase
MIVSAEALRAQLVALLRAWGMGDDDAATTGDVLIEADLRGIESHGAAMMPWYDELRRAGKINFAPRVKMARETVATALIDADCGLGHVPGVRAMRLAIDKSTAAGIGCVVVVNSNHYGAAGIYAEMAAKAGRIGMTTSTTHMLSVVPTFGAEPMLGTNPIAIAAPARRNPPFVLDMATSTVAVGKINVARLKGRSIPAGWALDERGQPVIDPERALARKHLTPLGGTRELGSHKGYGLGVAAHILAAVLGGASFTPLRQLRQGKSEPDNIGQFFLAIDPQAFRADGAFEDDLDDVIDALHGTRPAAAGQSVLVAGDPERTCRAERTRGGIEVPDRLVEELRGLAAGCDAPFTLSAASPAR